jgi:hypothetical protein
MTNATSFPLDLLLEASIVGADDKGFDLLWGENMRGRFAPDGGLTAQHYELFRLEPPDEDEGDNPHGVIGSSSAFSTTPIPCRSSAASSLVVQDTTGLWHSPDFMVCRDSTGQLHNLDPIAAKVVEAFNSWLSQGLRNVGFLQVLQEMQRLSHNDPKFCKVVNHFYFFVRRDHFFKRHKLWRTLVGPGHSRGTYRLLL